MDTELALDELLFAFFLDPQPGRELPAHDVDAFGRGFAGLELVAGVLDFFRQRGLAGPRLADDEQLGFAEVVDAGLLALPPVVFDRFQALFDDFGGWYVGLVVIPTEREPFEALQLQDFGGYLSNRNVY